MKKIRSDQPHIQESRQEFLSRWNIKDEGQRILVYFGGNNEEYFEKAFPAFLKIFEESFLSNDILVLQQHPGAKKENRDRKQLESSAIKNPTIISDESSFDIQKVADVALYYQTSMGSQFVLAGIPVVQVGHEPFNDVLVRNELAPSVTSSTEFSSTIQNLNSLDEKDLSEDLGLKKDWKSAFLKALGLKVVKK